MSDDLNLDLMARRARRYAETAETPQASIELGALALTLESVQSKLSVMQTECYENSRMRAALNQICEATDHPDFEAAVETILREHSACVDGGVYRGCVEEVQRLRSSLSSAITLLRDIQKDLIDRSVRHSDGTKVVNLSASIWDRLDEMARPAPAVPNDSPPKSGE